MSSDVSHQDAGSLLVGNDKVIEIARDGRHGEIGGGNAKILDVGNSAGKNRRLYLSGDVEFVFNGDQSALVREHELQRYVSK